jgi:hypothetical protein
MRSLTTSKRSAGLPRSTTKVEGCFVLVLVVVLVLEFGDAECWSVGVLECWSVGAMECWSEGAMGAFPNCIGRMRQP